MKKIAIITVLFIAAALSEAGAAEIRNGKTEKKGGAAPEPRIIRAVRAEEPILIDARLDEKAWQVPPSNGFIQNDPKDGEPAIQSWGRHHATTGSDGSERLQDANPP